MEYFSIQQIKSQFIIPISFLSMNTRKKVKTDEIVPDMDVQIENKTFDGFDSEAFYAQYVCTPVKCDYKESFGNYDDLLEYCPDLNGFIDGRTIIERLTLDQSGCDFINQHPEMSLLPLYFKSHYFLDDKLKARMVEEIRQLTDKIVTINATRPSYLRVVLSKILRKWDKIPVGVQCRMLLIRLSLMVKDKRPDFKTFIPDWITNIAELQLGYLNNNLSDIVWKKN